VVDLGIAANFVRELTEDQFREKRDRPRRTAGPKRAAGNARETTSATNRGGGSAATPHRAVTGRRAGFAATRVGRTLSRLAQVRG
jgi:hypothetical protein